MKIVIHTCCADCFLNTLNYISANKNYKKNLEIVSFFFNPNMREPICWPTAIPTPLPW